MVPSKLRYLLKIHTLRVISASPPLCVQPHRGMASWYQHVSTVELHPCTYEWAPIPVTSPSSTPSPAGTLEDMDSSISAWPYYLTGGMYVSSWCVLNHYDTCTGTFASMVGYYSKVFKKLPIGSLGAVSIKLRLWLLSVHPHLLCSQVP